MKRIRESLRRALAPGAVLLALLLAGGAAPAVTLTLGTASGRVGDTVLVPVSVSGLAGSVSAFELNVNWSTSHAQVTAVNTAGTLTAGWSVSPQLGAGTVRVVGASATPLSGNGVLCVLQFLLGPSTGTAALAFGTVVLNEGTPVPSLANGSLVISARPTINISPDAGLLAVGDSLRFSTTGGTAPYSYASSDPTVASFRADWLRARAPGFVQATATDADGITNATTGLIEVRPFRLIVGNVTVFVGQTAVVPVRLDDPAPYGLRSAEVELTWPGTGATYAGIETAGTIASAAGWSAEVASGAGRVLVTLAGVNPLASAGVLFYLKLIPATSTYVDVGSQVFNETYSAVPTRGLVTATALPTIGITPTSAALKVGDQLTFAVTGTPTPPYTWSSSDPAVATITSAGLLRAVGEGSVRVSVVDNLGASAQTGAITVCGLALPSLVSSISANVSVVVPVRVDRPLGPLAIHSYEIAVSYAPAKVAFVRAMVAGSQTEAWGTPTVVDNGGVVSLYHAGAAALTGCEPALVYLEFRGLPGLVGSYTGVALTSALFNEGTPCTRVNTGALCSYASGAPAVGGQLRLWPNQPNPFNPATTILFDLPEAGSVRLSVYDVAGRLVRTLIDGQAAAGHQQAVWDGRDMRGCRVSSGSYLARLEFGGMTRTVAMALLQ